MLIDSVSYMDQNTTKPTDIRVLEMPKTLYSGIS